MSKIVTRLFRERQEGDYGFFIDICEDEMNESVNLTEQFEKEIENYLKKENLLA